MAVTRADAARLLALVQAFDHRNVADADIMAWADALHDLDFEDCSQAIRSYFRDSSEWLMPAAVRQRVKAIRETAAERAHRANMHREIEAPRNPGESHQGYLAAVQVLAERVGRTEYDRGKADAEQLARTVRCPFCHAGVGLACTNSARQNASRDTAHPARAEAAIESSRI